MKVSYPPPPQLEENWFPIFLMLETVSPSFSFSLVLGLTLLTCCSCGDKTQSHEFRLAELQTKVSEESLRKMKAELVSMLVKEHQTMMKLAEMDKEAEESLEVAMMTKPVVEEVKKEEESSDDTEEEEEDVTKPPQVIYIPPALQPLPFDPTALAR